MEHKEVQDITIGKLAAENEPSLDQYFIETPIYRRVRLGHTKVLIGARGSGKSAIFRIFAEQEKLKGTLVEEVTPNDYLYEVLKNSNRLNPDAEWKKFGAYTASWKYSILLSAMKLLYQKHKKSSPSADAIKTIRTYLKENI